MTVKRYSLLHGAIAETFEPGTDEPGGDYVKSADYDAGCAYAERLHAALERAAHAMEFWMARKPLRNLDETIAEINAALESTEARIKPPPSSVNDGACLSPNEVAAQSGSASRAAQAVEAR